MPIAANHYFHYHSSQEKIGLPIVLIHGAGGDHLAWPAELRRLKNHRVYALDLPGHGKSAGCSLQSIAAYAKDVQDWMDAVNLPKAVFIGHSMGAAIAMTIALEYPDSALGLGLVGGAARLRVASELLHEASSVTTYHRAIERLMRWSFSPLSSERIKELAAKRLAETRQSVLYSDLIACNDFDITANLSSIHVPTLIICGADDKMTPVKHSQYINSQINGASLHVIDDAGHMVMLEKPVEVARIISTFLLSLKP